jgi:hypothetical protein
LTLSLGRRDPFPAGKQKLNDLIMPRLGVDDCGSHHSAEAGRPRAGPPLAREVEFEG